MTHFILADQKTTTPIDSFFFPYAQRERCCNKRFAAHDLPLVTISQGISHWIFHGMAEAEHGVVLTLSVAMAVVPPSENTDK